MLVKEKNKTKLIKKNYWTFLQIIMIFNYVHYYIIFNYIQLLHNQIQLYVQLLHNIII